MSVLWGVFAVLTVIGSTLYNFSVKSAGDHVNPFIFTVMITIFAFSGHAIALFLNKIFFNTDLKFEISNYGLGLAFLAGLGIVIIDLAYFFAVKYGGLTISNTFWTVGSLILVILIGLFYFNEQLTAVKSIGLFLGFISIVLLVKA